MDRREFFRFLSKGAVAAGFAAVIGLPKSDLKPNIPAGNPENSYVSEYKDNFYNRVKVKYTQIDTSVFPARVGLTTETKWADDFNSQKLYGIREKIYTASAISDKNAIALRDEYLNQFAYPAIIFDSHLTNTGNI